MMLRKRNNGKNTYTINIYKYLINLACDIS